MIFPSASSVHLVSSRLAIRPFQKGDGAAVLDLVQQNQRHLAKVLPSWVREIDSLAQADDFIRKMRMGWMLKKVLAFGIWQEERLIGEIIVFEMTGKRAEIGYMIDERQQGKGYASEAMQVVAPFILSLEMLTELIAMCPPWHVGSRKVAEKCGFRPIKEDKDYVTYLLEGHA